MSFLKGLCSQSANCSGTLSKTGLSATNSLVYGAAARQSAHGLSLMTVAKWSMSGVSLRGHGLIPRTREDVVSQELVQKNKLSKPSKLVPTKQFSPKRTAVNNASRKSTQA